MEVKCKGNTQITHMEETEKRHGVIRLMPSTGVWTFEIPQNLNCPESGLFLAQFNPQKRLLKQRKNSCKLGKICCPVLSEESEPLGHTSKSKLSRIQTFPSLIQPHSPQKKKIAEAKKELMQARCSPVLSEESEPLDHSTNEETDACS